MKFKVFSIVMVLALLLVGVNVGSVFAGAYDTAFTTSITYQNVGGSPTTQLEVWFYPEPDTVTPTILVRPNLNPGAGTSLYIGGVDNIAQGFRGTAIMVSDQPLVATLVQIPTGSATVIVRPLSNGFENGNDRTLLATVLKNAFGGQYTILSAQNVGNATTDATFEFYNTSATKVWETTQELEPGAGFYIDTGTVSQLGTTFNGSAVVTTNGGNVVSSALELDSGTGIGAKAFEGLGAGAMEFYMPSALCNYNGQNTSYAVQNTSDSTSTMVTVEYSDGSSESATIGPKAKGSFAACSAGTGDNFIGSAIVSSDTTDVIAIGKKYGAGLSTAFVGAAGGTNQLALPYVRWATQQNYFYSSQQRVYIAIQNVGGSDIAAGAVTAEYIDRNGNVVATHVLPAIPEGQKVNSTAELAGLSEFGVYNNGTEFGGGVVISGPVGSQLAAIATVISYNPNNGTNAGEDYNGIDF